MPAVTDRDWWGREEGEPSCLAGGCKRPVGVALGVVGQRTSLLGKVWRLAFVPLVAMLIAACGQVPAKEPVTYRFEAGKTAMLKDGVAYAPRRAPAAVKRAIAAGNRLQGKPYQRGGGHAKPDDTGYDCSGSVSYVLRHAGLLKGSLTSRGFAKYGKRGAGRWITVYFKDGHVFVTVAGLRLDTGGRSNADTGPRWKPETRGTKGFYMRHPPGL